MLFLFQSDSINQLFENAQTAATLGLMENTMLFIFICNAVFFIVITPVVLFYMLVDNYYKSKKNYSIIAEEFAGKIHNHHPSFSIEIREKYQKNYARFLSSTLGLIGWNLFSFVYIVTGWDSLQEGIVGYFKFPFVVIQTYSFDNSMNTINAYDYNWFFMFVVFIITIGCFLLGKYLAPYIIQRQITKGENVSLLFSNISL